MTESKISIFGRVTGVLRDMTVEPVSFLMVFVMILSMTGSQTLSIEKTCRVNLQLSTAVCDALRQQESDEHSDSEKIVQEYLASYVTYKTLITSLLPCTLLVFSGGWMDLTGRRKVLMMLPIFGQILQQANNIINVSLFYRLNVQFFIFSDAILSSVFGGFSILFLAVFSFITDITSEKNRTLRVGLVSFSTSIAMPVGSALSGFLLKTYGYMVLYVLTLSLSCINMCYTFFKIRDPSRTAEHKAHDNRGFVYFTKTFFNPAHFLNSGKVVFKKTENNRARMLCILIITACFVLGPVHGEGAIMYMSTRYRFQWDELQYSLFQTFNMVITAIATIFAMMVLSSKLGWHDSVLGIMSTSSKIAAAFLYCYARTGTAFFMGPIIDMINGTAAIAVRSMLSKAVENHEISQVTSIISIAEVVAPLAFVTLYINVYISTIDVLPGAVFLMGAGFTVPPLGVFLWIFYRHRKSVNKEKIELSTPEQKL